MNLLLSRILRGIYLFNQRPLVVHISGKEFGFLKVFSLSILVL